MSRIANFASGPIPKPRPREQSKHRIIDVKHLAFIRSLPCVASAADNMIRFGCIAHHITLGRYRMGRKAGDDMTVPLLPSRHNVHPGSLHEVGERVFWAVLGIDAIGLARELYQHTGDYAACTQIIAARCRNVPSP